MELSYKIIKKNNLNFSEDTVQINYDKTSYKKKVRDFDSTDHINKNDLDNTGSKEPEELEEPASKEKLMQDFLDDLEEEKEKIIQEITSQAKEEAKDIKKRAMEEGYAEGHARGYRKGIEESSKEGQDIKEKAISILAQCEEEAKNYIKSEENKIIKLAGDMAKLIVNYEIDSKNETLLEIIKPIIEDYKRGGLVVISCDDSHQKFLKENTKALKEINPELEFIILRNPNLEKNAVTLEYQNKIIYLNISQQIESMVEQLQNLEVESC